MPLDTLSAEYKRVIHDFNDTHQTFANECVHELFHKQALKSPSAAALELAGQVMSYEKLLHQALHLASYLENDGVPTQSKLRRLDGTSIIRVHDWNNGHSLQRLCFSAC